MDRKTKPIARNSQTGYGDPPRGSRNLGADRSHPPPIRRPHGPEYPAFTGYPPPGQYGPGGHWVPEGPYGQAVAAMRGQPPMQGQPWGYMGPPGAGPPPGEYQYGYPPAQPAWPPAEAAPSPVFPQPGGVWPQHQPAPHPWQQQPSVDISGHALPWQRDAQVQQQAQMQQEEPLPPPPPSDGPPGAPPLPDESAPPAPPDGSAIKLASSGPPLPAVESQVVDMEIGEPQPAMANGTDDKLAAGQDAIPGQGQPQLVLEQPVAKGVEDLPLKSNQTAAVAAALTVPAGPSSAGNSRHSSPMGRPSFLKSNPPIMMTLKRRDGISLAKVTPARSPVPSPKPQKAATPPPEKPSAAGNSAPAPQENGDAPPEDKPKPQRRRRQWDEPQEAVPSQGTPLQGAPRQGTPHARATTPAATPMVSSRSRLQPGTKERRKREEKERSVSTSSSSGGSRSQSPSSSRTSSGEGTSTSGRDRSETPSKPTRSGRRGSQHQRSRARDSRSPMSRSPARRTNRMRSRPRSRSPYRSSQHRRWHRRSRTRSRSRERSRYQSVRPSPERRYTPHHPPLRRRSPTRHPSRSPMPVKPARLAQSSRRRSRTPPRRFRDSPPIPAELEDEDDDEVPPPPPDEPMPSELDQQLEMEAITAMDQHIQARITEIAVQYGCDFNTLDIHGCRDFCETLYAQVYPEHPDFSAWDASDAAELAAMQQEEAAMTMGMEFARQGLPDISDVSLGPAPLDLEDRLLSEVLEKPVLLSPDEQAAGDPRNRPEAGELEPEQAPVLLPVPLFALGPPEAAVAPGGSWEEDSVFSWSESPRRAGLKEEVDSNPAAAVAADEAQADVMRAPAAPRHETIVRDDDRDWTKEQMARAQEQAATSVPRGPLKEPEKGEDWSWIEVHRERGFGFTSRPYSFFDLRSWAEERKYGLDFGVPVYRKMDGLWLPLSEAPVHLEDLEWGGSGQTPVHAAAAEEAGPRPEATTVRHTVAQMEAAELSDEAAAQWLKGAPTSLSRLLLPTMNGRAASEAFQASVKENGHASPAGDDTPTVSAWLSGEAEGSLMRLAEKMGRARMEEEAARKRRKLSSAVIPGASTADGRRLWGAPPPPQHSAMLRGKLATAVLSGAVGKTIVADVITKAAIKVLETRGAEVETRRAAQQAKRAERAPKPGTPEQRGRGSGRASKSHHGRDEGPPSASKRRESGRKDAPAIQEPDASERPSHQRPSREDRRQAPDQDRGTPSRTAEERAAAAPRHAATPAKARTPAPAEEAKPAAADAIKQEAEPHARTPPPRDSAVKAEPEAGSRAPARQPQTSARPKAESQPRSSADAEDVRNRGGGAASGKGSRAQAPKARPNQNKRRMKHILADNASEDTGVAFGGEGAMSDDNAAGPPGSRPSQKRQRLQKHASLDALQATPATSEDGVSVAVADAAPEQAREIAEAGGGGNKQQPNAQEGAQRGRTAKVAGSRLKPQAKDKGKAAAKSGRGRAAQKGRKRRTGSREASEWEGDSQDERTEKKGHKTGGTKEDQDSADDEERLIEEERRRLQALAWEQHRDKQYTEAFDRMLRALMKKDHQIENVFLKPVDTTDLPDYPSIIKQPICISDIMKKQRMKAYPPRREGLDALLADVKLMCDNCRLYNMGNSEYVGYADDVESCFRDVAEAEWRKTTEFIKGRRM